MLIDMQYENILIYYSVIIEIATLDSNVNHGLDLLLKKTLYIILGKYL